MSSSTRDAAGHPASSEEIAGHLLDRVLPAAYTHQPGEPLPRYDPPAAARALRRIAARMNKEETRDLRWWHVPAWAHATPRFIVTWLATCLVVGLGTGLMTGFEDLEFFPGDLVDGFVFGLVLGLVLGYVFGRGDKIPKRIAPVRWRQLFRRTPLMVGLLAALLTGPWVGPGIGAGIGAGLVAWFGAGLVARMSRPGTDSTSPLSPLAS